MSETPKQCPECASNQKPNSVNFECGSAELVIGLMQTPECSKRAIASLRAQLADSQRLRAEAERERDNWRKLYREVYCRLWWASEDEFENEAMGEGVDHGGVLVECDRMNKALSDLTDEQKRTAELTARAEAAEKRAVAMQEVVANHWTDIPPGTDGWWLFHEYGDPKTECRILVINGVVAADEEWEQHMGAKPSDDANYWEGNRVEDLTVGPLTKGMWKRYALLAPAAEEVEGGT